MGISAAKTEGADPHHRRCIGLWERLQLGLHLELQTGEIDRGVRGAEMQARGQLAMVDAERRLDQTGDACGGFRVAEVGLHRSDPAGLTLRPAVTQDGAQRPQLNRVPLAGAGAMGLHVLSGRRSNPGAGKSLSYAGDLGPQVGGDHAVAAAIGVHRRAVDQGVDPIPIGLSHREGLQ